MTPRDHATTMLYNCIWRSLDGRFGRPKDTLYERSWHCRFVRNCFCSLLSTMIEIPSRPQRPPVSEPLLLAVSHVIVATCKATTVVRIREIYSDHD